MCDFQMRAAHHHFTLIIIEAWGKVQNRFECHVSQSYLNQNWDFTILQRNQRRVLGQLKSSQTPLHPQKHSLLTGDKYFFIVVSHRILLLPVLYRWGAVWLHHSKGPSIRGGDQGVFQADRVSNGLRAQPRIRTQGPQTGNSNQWPKRVRDEILCCWMSAHSFPWLFPVGELTDRWRSQLEANRFWIVRKTKGIHTFVWETWVYILS